MRRPGAAALAAWLAILGGAGVCTVALAAWLDPAHAQAWIALLAMCQ